MVHFAYREDASNVGTGKNHRRLCWEIISRLWRKRYLRELGGLQYEKYETCITILWREMYAKIKATKEVDLMSTWSTSD